MNKQSITGLVLIFAIFIGYMWWVSPSEEERAQMMAEREAAMLKAQQDQARQDSIIRLQDSIRAIQDSLAKTDAALFEQMKADINAEKFGPFGKSAQGDTGMIQLKNSKLAVDISTLGAQIEKVVLADYLTYDSNELMLITPSDSNMNLVFGVQGNRTIKTKDLVFKPYVDGKPVDANSTFEVQEGDSLTLCLRAYADADSANSEAYLEMAYTLGDNYDLGFEIHTVGLKSILNPQAWELHWNNSMNRQEKVDPSSKGSRNMQKDPERNYSSIYYKPVNDDVDNITQGRDDVEELSSSIRWIAYKQQFFSAILVCDTGFANPYMKVATDRDNERDNYMCDMSSILGIRYEGNGECASDMHFYLGPNKYRDLADQDEGFERMLPLGWGFFLTQWISRFVIIPVFNFLEQFNWNYGIIIIVLTLMLKLVLFPLVYKSYRSSAVMRILKPETDLIAKKYPNQDQMMQRSQEQQRLYKRAGISPMAGCLPMLVQLPILWAMFRFYPASIELRQQSFLWADDLSTYDAVINFGFNIPLYGDHVSLFCLLMFGMQFFYTWYTMKSQASQASMPGMKFMMYFMPFMMLFMFNSLSSALNLYYLLSLTITMLQMILIRKFTNEGKIRARMAAYDAKMAKGGKGGKSGKKSKFQQRLEALQKQAEEMQKQQKQQRR